MEKTNTFVEAEFEPVEDTENDDLINDTNSKRSAIAAISTMNYFKENFDTSDLLINYASKRNFLSDIFSFEDVKPFFYNLDLENAKTIYTNKETANIIGVDTQWIINHLRRSPALSEYVKPLRYGESKRKQYRFKYEGIFRLFLYHYLTEHKNVTYDEVLQVLGEVEVYVEANQKPEEVVKPNSFPHMNLTEVKKLISSEAAVIKNDNLMLLGSMYEVMKDFKSQLASVIESLSRQTQIHNKRKDQIYLEQKQAFNEINTQNLKVVQLKAELSKNKEVAKDFQPKLDALAQELEKLRMLQKEVDATKNEATTNTNEKAPGFFARLRGKLPEQKTIILKDYDELILKTTEQIQNITYMIKSLRDPLEIQSEITSAVDRIKELNELLNNLEEEHSLLNVEIEFLLDTVKQISVTSSNRITGELDKVTQKLENPTE